MIEERESKWKEYNKLFKMRSTFFNSHITRLITYPIYCIISPFKISPNIISFTSLLLTIIAVICFFNNQFGYYILGALLFQIAFGFDCLDGIFARKYDSGSIFGKFLDLFLDRITNFIIVAGLFIQQLMIGNIKLNLINIIYFLIGSSLYYIYVNTAQLKGLIFKRKENRKINKLKKNIILMPYQFLDNGVFLLLISLSVIFNIYLEFIFLYGIYNLIFTIIIVYLAYKKRI